MRLATSSRDDILAKILRLIVYLSAFMPLVIWNQYISPFHFGKVIIFRSVVEIMAVIYIALILKDRSYLPKTTKLFWAVTAFVAVYGLTTLTSVSFYPSFWGTLERMGGWYSMLHFWVFFVILCTVMRTRQHWVNLFRFSFIAALASASYGFLQKTSWDWILGSGGRNKIFGTIGNPALFAGYMMVNTFLAYTFVFLPSETRSWKKFYVVVAIVGSLAILMTGVRGSVIALVLGIFLLGFLYSIRFGSKKLKEYSISFFVIAIILAGVLYSLRNTDFIKNNQYLARYSDISPASKTVQTRFWAWQAGFDGLNDSARAFIVGYGPENFNVPFSIHFNPKFYAGPGSETLFDRAHNQFLEVLFTMGILGFIAYLSVFFFAFKILTKSRNSENPEDKFYSVLKIGGITTLVAYAIHNSFIFDTSANYLMFFFLLGLVNFLSFSDKESLMSVAGDKKRQPVANGGFLSYPVGFILLIPAFLLLYFTNIMPTRANYTSTRGIILGWDGKTDAAVEKYKEAIKYGTFGKYEIRQRYLQYILEVYSDRQTLDEKALENLLYGVDCVKSSIAEFPQDYLPYLYLTRVYVNLGKSDIKSAYNDLALESVNKALEISPTFVRSYYELAQVYLNKKDFKNAIAAFQKAADLNPDVGLTWWYLAAAQYESGDKDAGDISLKRAEDENYQYTEKDLRRVIFVFVTTEDYDKVAEYYQKLVDLKPNDAQYRASLAVAYGRIGKYDQAVEQAKAAAKIDPAFEEEARAFVRSLGRTW